MRYEYPLNPSLPIIAIMAITTAQVTMNRFPVFVTPVEDCLAGLLHVLSDDAAQEALEADLI